MLSRTIQKVTSEFITAASETARTTEKKIQELAALKMYTPEYLAAEKTKIEEAGAVAMGLLRDKSLKNLAVVFDNARATIENSVSENTNTTEFQEIKNILEASGGNFSEFELSVILNKAAGSYWSLKMLSNAVSDTSDAKKILAEKFKAPDPEYYMQLLNDEEAYLTNFIMTYDGKAVLGNQGIWGEVLLNGDHFEKLHERIMINPHYLTDDDFEAPVLRPAERRTLRKSGINLDLTDKVSRQIVIEATHKGGTLRNMLVRTCWADTIKAEEKRMWENAKIDAQIKYKSAWLDVVGAVNAF